MSKITKYEALGALAQAVTERGRHYVYPGDTCRYRWSNMDEVNGYGKAGEAACLAGRALDILGVLDELVPRQASEDLQVTKVTVVCARMDPDHKILSLPAIMVLTAAQYAQDYARTWGEALDDAAKRAMRP